MGVPVTGTITTTGSGDTYATTDPLTGIDGWRSVADTTARNAITTLRRRQGMAVWVQAAGGSLWTLNAAPWAGDDTDWTVFSGGGGGLPSGMAGQSLIYNSTTPAFSSIIEVYSATSPHATGTKSTVLNAASGSVATGVSSHADSGGQATGDECHADSFGLAGTAAGAHADSGGTANAAGSHADSSGVSSSSSGHADSGGTASTGTFGHGDSQGTAVGDGAHANSNGTANGVNSFACSGGIADGDYSQAVGLSSLADTTCKFAQAGSRFSTHGDQQATHLVLAAITTNATPAILTIYTDSTLPVIRSNTTYGFIASVVGRGTAGTDHVWWIRKGLIHNEAGTVSLAGEIGTVGADTGTTTGLTWGLAITADNTGKALQIQVTGAVATTIHWTCKLECVEVG